MDVGIIGAGSIGLLMSAYLGRDHNVSIYVRRKSQRDQLLKHGVYCDRTGQRILANVHLVGESMANHDVLFITVKQHEIDQVVNILPLFNKDNPVVFLQNGMGHLDKLPFKEYRCWVGVVEHGALKINDTYVRHTGEGKVQLASFEKKDPLLERFIFSVSKADFLFELHQDYYDMLSSKLIINAVINPLTAIFKLKNRSIHDNSYVQALARQLCKEACVALGRSFEEEWPRVLSVAWNTGENQSSMLKDLLDQRLTEVDAINGYILKASLQPLPYHTFVLQAIHAMEKESGEQL